MNRSAHFRNQIPHENSWGGIEPPPAYRGKALIFLPDKSPIDYEGFCAERSTLPSQLSSAPQCNASASGSRKAQPDSEPEACSTKQVEPLPLTDSKFNTGVASKKNWTAQQHLEYFFKKITASERLRTFYFVQCQTRSGICEFIIGSHHSCYVGSFICDTGMSSSSRSAQESLRALCPCISLASALSARSISLPISEYSIATSARPS